MSVSGSDSDNDFASAESDTEERTPSPTEKVAERTDSDDTTTVVPDPHEIPPVHTPSTANNPEKTVVNGEQPISADITLSATNTDPKSANIDPPNINPNIDPCNIDPCNIDPSSANIDPSSANIDPCNIDPSSANIDPPNIDPSSAPNIDPSSTNIDPSSANIEPSSEPPNIKPNTKDTNEPSTSVIEAAPTSGGSGDAGGGGGWGGAWGGWGSSLWSSVSTVAESAQAIGKKVTSVIASVEDTLGVPSPEELVEVMEGTTTLDKETKRLADDMVEHDVSVDPVKEEPHHSQEGLEGLDLQSSPLQEGNSETGGEGKDNEVEANLGAVSGFFSGFAAAVQTTGQGFVSGGLDALETLGKKTMEVLSEGDPGLAKKRAMLGVGSSTTLSQLLQEAKSESATRLSEGDSGGGGDTAHNYTRFFDEYHGVGHLEALELLSKECAAKTHGMFEDFDGSDLCTLQEHLAQLLEAFSIEEDQSNLDDDSCQLGEIKEVFSDITLTFKLDKLIKVSAGWREKAGEDIISDGGKEEEEMEQFKKSSSEVLYENGLRSLAELTSTSIEVFRKMAEMSLLTDVPCSDPLILANKFNRLTVLVTNEFDGLASVYSEAITSLDLEGTNSRVASLYLESSNSGSYIQDAFQLLLPMFKFTLMQQQIHQEPSPNILNRN